VSGLETEKERVTHEINYYTHLLANPQAMEEFRTKVAARRDLKEVRDLQVAAVRQNVTFIGCRFEENTYGFRSQITNYGAIGVETEDNDCVVSGCLFTGNQFGDINIVVCTSHLCWKCVQNYCWFLPSSLTKFPVSFHFLT